ncbi:MAG: multicopper oxidase domain-containing protein [Armatimonadetes bacterium]|nr:multicopper oxidase domain-containing protein [Armatimonadota bacterium]
MARGPNRPRGLTVLRRDPIEDEMHFRKFYCPPTEPNFTPDAVTPTVQIRRELMRNIDLTMPDGREVEMWVVEDPDAPDGERRQFPSRMVRVSRGEIVHARVGAHTNTHTIHWHGIEPCPAHDGVGKSTFEISGNYTYQWQPRFSGTYLFHCHKNTVLHFEMGLYGYLIIDPPGTDPNVFPRRAFDGGPVYHVEAFWAGDEIDSRWHTLGHDAFMRGCDIDAPFTTDGFLNEFNPDYFVVTGVPSVAGQPITDARVTINAVVGQTILIRVLNGGYCIQNYSLPALGAQVIAVDGRALGQAPFGQYSQPYALPAGTPLSLTTARRADLLITPTAAQVGAHRARVEFVHWISGEVLHVAETLIQVAAA